MEGTQVFDVLLLYLWK